MTEDATGLDHEIDAQRSSTAPEWEVFVSEGDGDPLTHAGSVTAPSESIAVEQAEKLFEHAAETLWLCPATEVTRRTTDARALAER
ncbi:Htur_1727 family rSAM-partnered candidate RiPP [Halomicrobium salinisoli]|uniref:Htur_1727 family rSAM-partnered candidate RiPP n=1 Tax=Halomicrobium salinisoli TaxID=2878391 RepID=UPI001CF0095B|nr:Htur_1727 family rSAM-partnered candidate RiPP [Halomicrobium salinisoli]